MTILSCIQLGLHASHFISLTIQTTYKYLGHRFLGVDFLIQIRYYYILYNIELNQSPLLSYTFNIYITGFLTILADHVLGFSTTSSMCTYLGWFVPANCGFVAL